MGFVWNYVRNLGSLAAGRPARRPLLFSYYVTHRCALACAYCSDGQGRPFREDVVAELSTGEARDLIARLRRSSDTLDITGGEPMLREDLEDLLDHARRLGFRTVLNTKGIGLPERADILRLADTVVLSVDALAPERMAAILGGSSAAAGEVLRSLDWVLGRHDRRGARVVISSVAMPENLGDVSEVLRFAVKHRLGFQVSPWIDGTTAHPGLRANARFRALVDEVIAARAAGAGVLGVLPYLRGIRDFRPYVCRPLLMPTIRPDGTANLPCLERPRRRVDVRAAGGWECVLAANAAKDGPPGDCDGKCLIFCHMALSLLQRHPVGALGELVRWRSQPC